MEDIWELNKEKPVFGFLPITGKSKQNKKISGTIKPLDSEESKMSDSTNKPKLISEKVATEQMQILYDYYDIDIEEATGDPKTALQNAHQRLINAIRKGRLAIEDKDGLKVTQIVRGGDTLEYKVVSGGAKLAMKAADSENHRRMYQMLAYLVGLTCSDIAKLTGFDLSVAECLGLLFLYV